MRSNYNIPIFRVYYYVIYSSAGVTTDRITIYYQEQSVDNVNTHMQCVLTLITVADLYRTVFY